MHAIAGLKRLVIAAALVFASLLPSAAFAQIQPRVIVPDGPGGSAFTGCYSVNGTIYGSYKMSFCLTQRGSYSVTGGGVRCDGRLNWNGSRSDVTISLRRTRCGNGVAWSADRIVCKSSSLLSKLKIASLKCTYYPQAKGYKTTTIYARRYN
ncbi:MAG TPA: hypothetical protein VGM83_06140 [Devosiaceae bacterium]